MALTGWCRRLGGGVVLLATRCGVAADLADGAIVRLINAAAEGVGNDCAQAGGERGGERAEIGEESGDRVAGHEGCTLR